MNKRALVAEMLNTSESNRSKQHGNKQAIAANFILIYLNKKSELLCTRRLLVRQNKFCWFLFVVVVVSYILLFFFSRCLVLLKCKTGKLKFIIAFIIYWIFEIEFTSLCYLSTGSSSSSSSKLFYVFSMPRAREICTQYTVYIYCTIWCDVYLCACALARLLAATYFISIFSLFWINVIVTLTQFFFSISLSFFQFSLAVAGCWFFILSPKHTMYLFVSHCVYLLLCVFRRTM